MRVRVRHILGILQYGAMHVQGTEHVVHLSRRQFRSDNGVVMLTLDMRNAFNTLARDVMMIAVHAFGLHDLYNIVHFLYDVPSALFSEFVPGLRSKQGVRQGDPLGPILFALAIHPTLQRLAAAHPRVTVRAYLDDITVIGRPEDVRRFYDDFVREFGAIGKLDPSRT